MADSHPRVRAATAAGPAAGHGCAHPAHRAGRGRLPGRRGRPAARQLPRRRGALHRRQPRLHGPGRRSAGAAGGGVAGVGPRGAPARRRDRQGDQGRAPGSGPHRHPVRPAPGGAAPGPDRGGARAAGDRSAGGGGPRLRPPPRHRRVGHGACGLGQPAGGGKAPGCQHPDPAAGAQRPAGHRQGADLGPQVQRDPVRDRAGGALRQAHDPGDLPQPGLPGPARRPGDPRHGLGRRILVRSRPVGAGHRADGAADRAGEGAVLLRPAQASAARAGTAQHRPVDAARHRPDRRRRIPACAPGAAGRDRAAGRGRGQPVPRLHRPGAPATGRRLSGKCAAGRRPDRVHRHVAGRPGLCRGRGDARGGGPADRQTTAVAGRGGGHRRARRRRAGRGWRARGGRTRVQPRRGSAATGRLAAQALRVPAGADPAAAVLAGQLRPGCAGDGAAGARQDLEPGQLGQHQPRQRARDRRAGPVLQPGHRAGGHAGRTGQAGAPAQGAGRHPGRAQSLADPGRHRPEPVRDGPAVPVPGLRRAGAAAARGARGARSGRAPAQALRRCAGTGPGRRFDRRQPGHRGPAAGGQ